ncbi:MAG: hypothetical protein N2Z20_00285, partial [Elusimicrobiales bacterium]|nr:hypothetical protein [Elusimicrobiales bacterium]
MKKLIYFLISSLWSINMNIYPSNVLEIYYSRDDEKYDGWKMWIWNKTENLEGFEIYFTTITQYGAKFILDLEKHNLFFKEIGLLPKY